MDMNESQDRNRDNISSNIAGNADDHHTMGNNTNISEGNNAAVGSDDDDNDVEDEEYGDDDGDDENTPTLKRRESMYRTLSQLMQAPSVDFDAVNNVRRMMGSTGRRSEGNVGGDDVVLRQRKADMQQRGRSNSHRLSLRESVAIMEELSRRQSMKLSNQLNHKMLGSHSNNDSHSVISAQQAMSGLSQSISSPPTTNTINSNEAQTNSSDLDDDEEEEDDVAVDVDGYKSYEFESDEDEDVTVFDEYMSVNGASDTERSSSLFDDEDDENDDEEEDFDEENSKAHYFVDDDDGQMTMVSPNGFLHDIIEEPNEDQLTSLENDTNIEKRSNTSATAATAARRQFPFHSSMDLEASSEVEDFHDDGHKTNLHITPAQTQVISGGDDTREAIDQVQQKPSSPLSQRSSTKSRQGSDKDSISSDKRLEELATGYGLSSIKRRTIIHSTRTLQQSIKRKGRKKKKKLSTVESPTTPTLSKVASRNNSNDNTFARSRITNDTNFPLTSSNDQTNKEFDVAIDDNGTLIVSNNGAPDLVVDFVDGEQRVKCGSSVALIEYLLAQNTIKTNAAPRGKRRKSAVSWLTTPSRSEEEDGGFNQFMHTFLLSFRTFLSEVTLAKVLLNQSRHHYNDEVLGGRVLHILDIWTRIAWRDFKGDAMLVSVAHQILQASRHVPKSNRLINKIKKTIVAKGHGDKDEEKEVLKRLSISSTSATSSLMIVADAIEIAEQLTLFNSNMYRKVCAVDFVSYIIDGVTSTELHNIVSRFDTEYYWVIGEIVNASNTQAQTILIEKFIFVASQCRSLNNFYSVFSIASALDSAKVSKLKQSWEKVSKEGHRVFAKLQAFISTDKNMKVYRQALKKVPSKAPRIPFLPIVMKDLRFIADSAGNVTKGLINFERLHSVASYAHSMHKKLNIPYSKITLNLEFKKYFVNVGDKISLQHNAKEPLSEQAIREEHYKNEIASLLDQLDEKNDKLHNMSENATIQLLDLEDALVLSKEEGRRRETALERKVKTLSQRIVRLECDLADMQEMHADVMEGKDSLDSTIVTEAYDVPSRPFSAPRDVSPENVLRGLINIGSKQQSDISSSPSSLRMKHSLRKKKSPFHSLRMRSESPNGSIGHHGSRHRSGSVSKLMKLFTPRSASPRADEGKVCESELDVETALFDNVSSNNLHENGNQSNLKSLSIPSSIMEDGERFPFEFDNNASEISQRTSYPSTDLSSKRPSSPVAAQFISKAVQTTIVFPTTSINASSCLSSEQMQSFRRGSTFPAFCTEDEDEAVESEKYAEGKGGNKGKEDDEGEIETELKESELMTAMEFFDSLLDEADDNALIQDQGSFNNQSLSTQSTSVPTNVVTGKKKVSEDHDHGKFRINSDVNTGLYFPAGQDTQSMIEKNPSLYIQELDRLLATNCLLVQELNAAKASNKLLSEQIQQQQQLKQSGCASDIKIESGELAAARDLASDYLGSHHRPSQELLVQQFLNNVTDFGDAEDDACAVKDGKKEDGGDGENENEDGNEDDNDENDEDVDEDEDEDDGEGDSDDEEKEKEIEKERERENNMNLQIGEDEDYDEEDEDYEEEEEEDFFMK
eukprot:m.233257 g.233257  ORF g.233257 m.233257 type:complete len:1578 (+) comp13906_c2_seq2:185-4918(+)